MRDLAWNLDDRVIVRSIIALARSLRIEVIAEGVETVEQRDFLQGESCRHIQGYFYSRPKPADEITPMIGVAEPEARVVPLFPVSQPGS